MEFLTSRYRELALDIDPDTLEPMPSNLRPHAPTDAYGGRDLSPIHLLSRDEDL